MLDHHLRSLKPAGPIGPVQGLHLLFEALQVGPVEVPAPGVQGGEGLEDPLGVADGVGGVQPEVGVAGAVAVVLLRMVLPADQVRLPLPEEDHPGVLGEEGLELGQVGLEAEPVGEEEAGLA